MKIQYLGHSSFLIKSKNGTVVTDPFEPKDVGLKFPKVEADLVTVSHQHLDHNNVAVVGGEGKLVFDFPGEYEHKGIRVFGYATSHDDKNGADRGENIIFKILLEGITITHCGDLGHIPNEEIMESLKDTDVLMLPVGGFYTIGPKEAMKIVNLINPEIIIPMHFNDPRLNQEAFKDLLPVKEFLTLMGVESLQPVDKLELKSDTLPEKEVVLLSF
ncbi:MAG: MBL fold metallo-hydrolase [Patescibacteria group bacterium]|jgi:L-ascorbate metabolism protein UlaG (beta-lactamase superfamily)